MNKRLSAGFAAIACAVIGAWAADTQTNLDNIILAAVLTASYTNGGYAVVEPRANIELLDADRDGEYIKDWMARSTSASTNAAVVLLVDRLFERNKMSGTRKAVQLSLPSSPKDGYIVDYERKYLKYFQNDGGDWPQFYKDNPKAQGSIAISLPAYDPETGLVLVFRGTHHHEMEGWGEVLLYKYDKGKLIKLNSVLLWHA